jgi:hypothetical protein
MDIEHESFIDLLKYIFKSSGQLLAMLLYNMQPYQATRMSISCLQVLRLRRRICDSCEDRFYRVKPIRLDRPSRCLVIELFNPTLNSLSKRLFTRQPYLYSRFKEMHHVMWHFSLLACLVSHWPPANYLIAPADEPATHNLPRVMGPAGFEPATSSARGWHPTMLDNGPL